MFDGWTRAAVDSAAAQLGIDPVQARAGHAEKPDRDDRRLYPGGRPRARSAVHARASWPTLKIREQIRALVWHRLELMGPAREAVRRALAILAMPQNVPLALRLGWRTADRMWRLAGDTSTDFNHYTKRMTLVRGLRRRPCSPGSTTTARAGRDTAAFLDRRIDDVMAFEKWKAGWRASDRRFSVSALPRPLALPAVAEHPLLRISRSLI